MDEDLKNPGWPPLSDIPKWNQERANPDGTAMIDHFDFAPEKRRFNLVHFIVSDTSDTWKILIGIAIAAIPIWFVAPYIANAMTKTPRYSIQSMTIDGKEYTIIEGRKGQWQAFPKEK